MRNRLTQDRATLFVDQYGQHYWACSLAELTEKTGHSHANKIYRDKADGSSAWVGYVVGPLWLTAYHSVEVAV